MTINEIRAAIKCSHAERESEMLQECVRRTESLGDIVEIGVEHGGSTAIMAGVLGPEDRRLIFAVDCNPKAIAEARANWERIGLLHKIRPLCGNSAAVEIPDALAEIGLLFIDGDHEDEGVTADFHRWSPHVVLGGLVAFHDYDCVSGPGVKPLVDDILEADGWSEWGRVDNLVVIQREPQD